ncbi:hypothetical protein quinque_001275 [Culex quinquefasciatus]|uniref:Uncharacterized protein n=1 Tax=Culex pipiens pipiens TaxID=38569 RepID=A0ABD1DDB8_CULPP
MIRCPYLHEMHERLLGPTPRRAIAITTTTTTTTSAKNAFPPLAKPENTNLDQHFNGGSPMDRESDCLLESRPDSRQIGTMVKLNPDGFGSHTTPTHHKTPLVPCNGTTDDDDDDDDCDEHDAFGSTVTDSDDAGIHLRSHIRKIIEGRKPKNAK